MSVHEPGERGHLDADPAVLTLRDLVGRSLPPVPWAEGDNIPWNDPGFSQRMLAEHLSQAHDLASRRERLIDGHIAFIERQLGEKSGARILDLGCGPGLYLHRLARLGHRGHGIDFGPASVAHARTVAAELGLACTFEEADLRSAAFDDGFDMALLIFGQINVFERDQARDILTRAHAALAPGGILVVEPQHPDAVRGETATSTDWSAVDHGLFLDAPHVLLHERFWDEPTRTATDRWYVIDIARGTVERHAMSTCSYEIAEMTELVEDAGFERVRVFPSLTGADEPEQPELFAIVASR